MNSLVDAGVAVVGLGAVVVGIRVFVATLVRFRHTVTRGGARWGA